MVVQARRVLDNIGAILKAAGLTFANVVRTTVFLADLNDIGRDEIRFTRHAFRNRHPGPRHGQVARLPRDE